MEEAIAIVTKYRDNVLGNNGCSRIQRAVLNSIIEDMQQRLTKRAVDLGWTCAKCSCSNIESDLLCGFCDTPRPSH
jgi:hypothetical protein